MTEFRWKIAELIITFLGIVAGAGVSIYVFTKGQRLETEKELQRLNSLETYIIGFIKDLQIAVAKQSSSLLVIAEQLKTNSQQNVSAESIVTLHIDGVKWISQEDLYKIFVTRKIGKEETKKKLFQEFNAHCDYIGNFKSNWTNTFDYFQRKYETYEQSWNENFKLTSRLLDTMKVRYEETNKAGNDAPYPFLLEVDNLMGTYSKLPNYREPPVAVDNFITPLQVLCRATVGDNNAIHFLHYTNDCLHAYDNHQGLREFTIEQLTFINTGLLKAGTELLTVVDSYEKMPTVGSESFIDSLRSSVTFFNIVSLILMLVAFTLFISFVLNF